MREFTHSMPVGRIVYLHLHPMSFEEFLEAIEGPAIGDYLTELNLGPAIGEAIEKTLIEALRRYFFIGGMPEVVRTYVESRDLLEVQRVQTALIQTVQDVFAKYGPRRLQELMRKTYRHVAENVGRKLKFVNVTREKRAADVRRALELLTSSGMVHVVYHTSANGLPLGAERDARHFKALFLDVGLVNRMCGLDLVEAEELVTVHDGALAEQFVGQELLCAARPFEDPQLFYWGREAKNANAEVVSRHPDIVPIEIKAGKTGTLRSLFQFLLEKKRRRAVRLHLGQPIGEEIRLPGAEETTVQLLSLPFIWLDKSIG